MNTYYFTWGAGHHDTKGRSLLGWYTSIEAKNDLEARQKMFSKFGSKWSSIYDEAEIRHQIAEYGLQYEPFEYADLCCGIAQDEYLKLKEMIGELHGK